MNWIRDPSWEREVAKAWVSAGFPKDLPTPTAWRAGRLAALVAREPVSRAGDDMRWHISVQHQDRIPNWSELVEAAHSLRPGVPLVIGIPPRSWWINVHPRVLHLYESRDLNLIEQWRFERKGDQPT